MATTNDIAQFHAFDASDYRVGIVVAQFNKTYTDAILESALETLGEYSIPDEHIHVAPVTGSVEIPVVLQKMGQAKKFDCLIAIGAIIKGESAHFDYVAKLVTDGVLRVQLDNILPVGFAVLTTYDTAQTEKRLHIGREAATAALHAVREIKRLD